MNAGKLSELILGRSVLKKITHKRKEVLQGARTGMDAVVLKGDGELVSAVAVSSSLNTSLPEKPFFSAKVVMNRAVNSILAEGTAPCAVLISLILPLETEEKTIKKIMDVFAAEAEQLDIQIGGGHSEVSKDVAEPVYSVTALGYRRERTIPDRKKLIGMDIVMAGYMAMEGTAMMAFFEKDRLKERFSSSYICHAKECIGQISIKKMVREKALMMHDVSESGIFGALWELGEKLRCGIEVELRKIPVRQETIELSEYLEINPYTMPSAGAVLMVAEDGADLVHELDRAGIQSKVIGKVTEGKDRVLLNCEERRFLEMPR